MYYRDTIDIVMFNLQYIVMMIVVLSLSSNRDNGCDVTVVNPCKGILSMVRA